MTGLTQQQQRINKKRATLTYSNKSTYQRRRRRIMRTFCCCLPQQQQRISQKCLTLFRLHSTCSLNNRHKTNQTNFVCNNGKNAMINVEISSLTSVTLETVDDAPHLCGDGLSLSDCHKQQRMNAFHMCLNSCCTLNTRRRENQLRNLFALGGDSFFSLSFLHISFKYFREKNVNKSRTGQSQLRSLAFLFSLYYVAVLR